MSLWVLGTDTGVGKTVISAMILARYAEECPLAYWKPVSSGGENVRDSLTVRGWVGREVQILEESYSFEPPVSPHLAARISGGSVDPERILADLVRHGMEDTRRNILIEGIGGLLVPLNDRGFLLIDLVEETALPAVLVTRSTLGTINHTLLSLEALRQRRIKVAGVVMNGPPNTENRNAIERFGRVKVTSEVPPLEPSWEGFQASESRPSRESILEAARGIDPNKILFRYLCRGGKRDTES